MAQASLGLGAMENGRGNDFIPEFDDETLIALAVDGFHAEYHISDNELFEEFIPGPLPANKRVRTFEPQDEAVVFMGETRAPASHEAAVNHIARSPAPVVDLTSNTKHPDDHMRKVLELFPDISREYAAEIVSRIMPYPYMRHQDRIIEEILAKPSYPKQNALKRKRVAAADDKDEWESAPARDGDHSYIQRSIKILVDEFPSVPVQYVRQVMASEKRLYNAYLSIFKLEWAASDSDRPYDRLKRGRRNSNGRQSAHTLHESLPTLPLLRELDAAREKSHEYYAAIVRKRQEAEAEKHNEEEHARAGTLVECQCCYADVPLNRAIACEATNEHYFCYSCVRKSAETQIGIMKWKLGCFDTSGCQANFARSKLLEAVGNSLVGKLESLQQQDEIARAGLEGLEACPFCEFKAICAPVEEDREFRCANPQCEIVSCRLCHQETHIPQTCEEARKDRGISERHLVEEAMTEALVRSCPRCGVKIIKELGCNKMACTQCGCLLCYVCKKDITREQYAHFGRGPKACRVDDDPREDRSRREVEEAQKVAIEKVRAENPTLTPEDLRVHALEETRRRQRPARAVPPGLPVDLYAPLLQAQRELQRPAMRPVLPQRAGFQGAPMEHAFFVPDLGPARLMAAQRHAHGRGQNALNNLANPPLAAGIPGLLPTPAHRGMGLVDLAAGNYNGVMQQRPRAHNLRFDPFLPVAQDNQHGFPLQPPLLASTHPAVGAAPEPFNYLDYIVDNEEYL